MAEKGRDRWDTRRRQPCDCHNGIVFSRHWRSRASAGERVPEGHWRDRGHLFGGV